MMLRSLLLLLAVSASLTAFAPTPIACEPSSATGAAPRQGLTVRLVSCVGYKASEQAKMRSSVAQLERVLRSDAFRDSVLQFRRPDGTPEFMDNLGLTNAQVYDRIMCAAEIAEHPVTDDYDVDLRLRLRNGWFWTQLRDKVYGYNNSLYGDPTIYTYRFKYEQLSSAEFTAHLAHEWMHSLGFIDNTNEALDDYGVPYAIGDIVENLAEAEGVP